MAVIEIENLDALEYLKTIPDGSIDMVLTDPPYAINYDGGKGWDNFQSEEQYLQWCYQWTNEALRTLKQGGIFAVFGTLKTDAFLKYKLYLSAQPEMKSQNEIIWSYNWGGRTRKNFARKHEYIWIYSKGNEFTFNADLIRVPRKMKRNLRTGQDYTNGTIPTCVWTENNHTSNVVTWHPTAKNLKILRRLINAYTNQGETVLDIFLGSGATAIAANQLNRNVKGCELDAEYYDLMLKRIEKECA